MENNMLYYLMNWINEDHPDPMPYVWLGVWVNENKDVISYDEPHLTYSNWGQGEPSETDFQLSKPFFCVAMDKSTGKWNDLSCKTIQEYICVKDMDEEIQSVAPVITTEVLTQPELTPSYETEEDGTEDTEAKLTTMRNTMKGVFRILL